jgi:alkanesulfonate monooxygenase SsuD/methylene tetrahydromethanopterin reductase-like flavin-dependent oxidoreductase (luciferase family)
MSASPSPMTRTTIHPWVAACQGPVRFGIAHGPQTDTPMDWPTLIAFVRDAEALGFDSFWVGDHPIGMPECWAMLALLAGQTATIRLGPLVSCVAYRPIGVLARLARDVDDASGGQLILGVGTGDNAAEFAQLGLTWGTLGQRQAALEAGIVALRAFLGQASPIPLLIAGGGERVTLRQVAQYADMTNFGAHAHVGSAFSGDDVRRKLAALRAHCAKLGRPYEAILKSHWAGPVVVARSQEELRSKIARLPAWVRNNFPSSMIAGTPEEVCARYRPLIAAGMQYCIAVVVGDDRETLRLLAEEVLPMLRAEP